MLQTAADDALPDFDGVYDDPCGASYELTADHNTLTISQYQYKFLFATPAPPGMLLEWDQAGPTMTTHMTWTATGGETESPVYEQDEPDTNGTIVTNNIQTSCP